MSHRFGLGGEGVDGVEKREVHGHIIGLGGSAQAWRKYRHGSSDDSWAIRNIAESGLLELHLARGTAMTNLEAVVY